MNCLEAAEAPWAKVRAGEAQTQIAHASRTRKALPNSPYHIIPTHDFTNPLKRVAECAFTF